MLYIYIHIRIGNGNKCQMIFVIKYVSILYRVSGYVFYLWNMMQRWHC